MCDFSDARKSRQQFLAEQLNALRRRKVGNAFMQFGLNVLQNGAQIDYVI